MAQWVFGQPFTAEADGSTTDFTINSGTYVSGTLTPYQGNLRFAYTDFFEISSTQIRFITTSTRDTATADATTDTLTATGHGRANGDIVTFSATTSLPGGLVVTTKYYVVNKATDTFQVSTSLGGAAVDLTSAESGTLYFAIPEAPIAANGLLYYDAYIGPSAPVSPVGLWDVDDFTSWYGLSSISATILAAVLTRADYRVQAFITVASYADAILDDPEDPAAASLIKYTIGDLALFYLEQQGMWQGAASEYSESYAGIKKYAEKYKTGDIHSAWTEMGILDRLRDYSRLHADFDPIVTWPSGRWSPTITVTLSGSDDISEDDD